MLYARSLVVIVAMLAAGGCMQTTLPADPPIDAVVYNQPLPVGGPGLPTGAVPPPPPVVGPPPPPGVPLVPIIGPPEELDPPYTLDSGDRLRVTVFGQQGLTNTYRVDASGRISMPLIGTVRARHCTTTELAERIAARLRRGFLREPHVAVEVETYRPFFILGEVTYPGQYPFVTHMTVETAVAIAGGFTPRAYRYEFEVTRSLPEGLVRIKLPPIAKLRPGDTVAVDERWF